MYRAQFRLYLAGFFAHLPNPRVICGIDVRHRARDSDRDIRAQRGRVATDTPEQTFLLMIFFRIFSLCNYHGYFPLKVSF